MACAADPRPPAISGTGRPGLAAAVGAILRSAVDYVRERRGTFALVWLVTLIFSVAIFPWDAPLLRQIQSAGADHQALAIWLSEIGRFENSSLALAVVLGIAALATRRPTPREAAVACLLAGLVAGLGVNVLRPTFGRARPHAAVEPGFYWFEMRPELHGMPSGHAASNTASAAAILMVSPALGIPVSVVAAGICWSRLQLNQHYPTDVLWGAVFGSSVGVAVGGSIRDRRRRARSRSSARS